MFPQYRTHGCYIQFKSKPQYVTRKNAESNPRQHAGIDSLRLQESKIPPYKAYANAEQGLLNNSYPNARKTVIIFAKDHKTCPLLPSLWFWLSLQCSADQSSYSSSHPPPPPSSITSTFVPRASLPCRIMLSSLALKASTRRSVSRSAASFFCASCLASASRRGLAWMSSTSIVSTAVLERRIVGAAEALLWLRR